MAVLAYPPFAGNSRIKSAAENSPTIRRGETNHEAVKILQQALIDAGFEVKKGADGDFGNFTAAAIQAAEAKYNLSRDSGIAGRQILTKLDEVLSGKNSGPVDQIPTILPARLRLMVQKTPVAQPLKLAHYMATATELCRLYSLEIDFVNQFNPPIKFAGSYNPDVDMESIRTASEKHTPGHFGALRVIFADFDLGRPEWAVTEGEARSGMQVQKFIVLNTGKIKTTGNTLLHEMVHAAGLSAHDEDQSSVFAQGEGGLNFKPEHAARVAMAFYSSRQG